MKINPNKRANIPIDYAQFWMPFTANREFKSAPRLLTHAEGMYYRTQDGQDIVDGTSGLWCVNAGHGRRSIADAVYQQLLELDYAPNFQMGHPIAFHFAERLAAIAPGALNRVFFTNSGSEAVDSALKVALAYQSAIGQPRRTRLIGRERAYHGVNFGGMSVGGLVNNRRSFGPLLPGVDHIRHTHNPDANAFSDGYPEHGAELADDLQRLIDLHGAETIAAVIVEPVAGSTGVLLPPRGYLERLRAIASAHGILLIFDEVITGFGRLGAPFATDHLGVTPDLITVAKGLTNGCVPMGAVLASETIYDAVTGAAPGGIEFFHGYTYSGHPVACAAGLATLDIYEDEGLLFRAATLDQSWRAAMMGLRDHGPIIDIRAVGLLAGIDLAPLRDAPGERGYRLFLSCLERGLLIRATGDTIALSPPLIITQDEIATIAAILADALAALH